MILNRRPTVRAMAPFPVTSFPQFLLLCLLFHFRDRKKLLLYFYAEIEHQLTSPHNSTSKISSIAIKIAKIFALLKLSQLVFALSYSLLRILYPLPGSGILLLALECDIFPVFFYYPAMFIFLNMYEAFIRQAFYLLFLCCFVTSCTKHIFPPLPVGMRHKSFNSFSYMQVYLLHTFK